jgi:hypothetical protein
MEARAPSPVYVPGEGARPSRFAKSAVDLILLEVNTATIFEQVCFFAQVAAANGR